MQAFTVLWCVKMRKRDEIVLWACIVVIVILAFLGGALTTIFTVWVLFFHGGVC